MAELVRVICVADHSRDTLRAAQPGCTVIPPQISSLMLAWPNTSRGGLAHQVAQFVWTIEVIAVPVKARLLCPQLELIRVHLEQVFEIGAESGFSGLTCDRAHGHLPW